MRGRREGEKPTQKTKTRTPRRAATRHARSEPRERGDARKHTSADDGEADPTGQARKRTSATERAARRTRSGTRRPPPAHQRTEAPAREAERTPETDDTGQAPAPPRPNAAKTETRRSAPSGTEDNTRASAPTEQPTATDAAEPRTDETTDETSGNADAGKDREPQKPTRENEVNIAHLNKKKKTTTAATANCLQRCERKGLYPDGVQSRSRHVGRRAPKGSSPAQRAVHCKRGKPLRSITGIFRLGLLLFWIRRVTGSVFAPAAGTSKYLRLEFVPRGGGTLGSEQCHFFYWGRREISFATNRASRWTLLFIIAAVGASLELQKEFL